MHGHNHHIGQLVGACNVALKAVFAYEIDFPPIKVAGAVAVHTIRVIQKRETNAAFFERCNGFSFFGV